jgi:hypothetical protein
VILLDELPAARLALIAVAAAAATGTSRPLSPVYFDSQQRISGHKISRQAERRGPLRP